MSDRLVVLIAFLMICQVLIAQTYNYTYTAICKKYDPTTQIAMSINMTGTNIYYVFSTCPSGKVYGPSQTNSSNQHLLICTDPIKNGGNCSHLFPEQCQSKVCINNICSNPVTSGRCISAFDTAEGYYCKDGIVTQSLHFNSSCSGSYMMECNKGACNMKTLKCDTYSNALESMQLPALIGGDSSGFKKCDPGSLDIYCHYNTSDGVKNASNIGMGCIPTKLASRAKHFCQMGGNEEVFKQGAKWAETAPDRRKVLSFLSFIGINANLLKNAVNCYYKKTDIPWFIVADGWKYTSGDFSTIAPSIYFLILLFSLILLI